MIKALSNLWHWNKPRSTQVIVHRQQTPSLQDNFSDARADYTNQQNNRYMRTRLGLPSYGAQADYHFQSEFQYYDIIERARDYDRNDALVSQTIDRVVSNIVSDGFTLIPETGDPKLDTELYNRWKEFSEDPEQCDLAGEWTWHDFELNAMRACLVDGDCVVTGTEDGPFQFLEAHNIGNLWATQPQNTFLGVTMNEKRTRTRYWVMSDPVMSSRRTNEKTVPMPLDVRTEDGIRQVFHVFDQKRFSITRGVTALYPVFIVLGMIEDINFAKLVQQQVVSCFAFLRKQSENAGASLPNKQGYGEPSVEVTQSGTRFIEGIQPGIEITTKPGEDIEGFSPNVPNEEFFRHFRQQVSLFGANMDMSPSQVLLDFSVENFVGYRGALHEARKGLRRRQNMLRDRLHSPAYKFKVAQWIASDPTLARMATRAKRIDPFNHIWQPRKFDYLEPVNDVKAQIMRVRGSMTSRRRLHGEEGEDWETISDEIVADNGYHIRNAKAEAAAINEEYPDDDHPVSWLQVASLPAPEGMNIGIDANPNDNAGGRSEERSVNNE